MVSERVETAAAMRAALKDRAWDFIFSDYMIPGFGGKEALKIAKERDRDLPFVIVSGKVGEEELVEVMKSGASDFLMKGNLGRLGSVVNRELNDAAARRGVRQAQFQWKAAFDSVQDAIFFHDADYRVVRANLAYAALGKMPIKEVIGKRYWEVFPRRDGPLPGCAGATVEQRQGGKEEEFTLPGGECYSSRSFSVKNDQGEYIYSLHVLQDITERNRVREAVEASERRFRSLIENASDLLVVADARGTVTYISPSIRAVGGYAVEEMLGKSYLDFMHPHDLPAARSSLSDLLREPGGVHATEYRFRRKDGEWGVLQSIARNSLADPAVRGIVINSRDVTEQKRSERALRLFRTLIEHAGDAIEVVDPETLRFLDFNQAACRSLGYSREELLSMRASDIDPNLDASARASVDARLRESKSAVFETVHRRKDGSTFPVEVSIQRVELDRAYHLVNARDITERKRSQAALERSERHFRKLIEGAGDAFFVLDEAGRIVYRSPTGKRLTGWDDEDVLGKSITDYVTPELLPLARKVLAETLRNPGKNGQRRSTPAAQGRRGSGCGGHGKKSPRRPGCRRHRGHRARHY